MCLRRACRLFPLFRTSICVIQLEQSALQAKFESAGVEEKEEREDEEDKDSDDEGLQGDFPLWCSKEFWLKDDVDIELRFARLENLLAQRAELLSSAVLRQNPHNIEEWHRRVELFEGNLAKQITMFAQAIQPVDPRKAVGKTHTLWITFACLYDYHDDLVNARAIFDKAVQVDYKTVDYLASVWCKWADMELRHKNFEGALDLMRCSTAEPSVEVKQRVADDGNEPVQMKLQQSLKLWSFYVDLGESLGTMESARAIYDRILDLRIATPQIILNYAFLLEEHKYCEDAFKVYERGIKIYKYPHVKDIWITYLCKFVKRYGKTKLERARELFEHAVEKAPAEDVKPINLQYAKLEEDYGLSIQAMEVYDRALKAIGKGEKLNIYEIYIALAAETFGVSKTRKIFEQAIKSGLSDGDVKIMC